MATASRADIVIGSSTVLFAASIVSRSMAKTSATAPVNAVEYRLNCVTQIDGGSSVEHEGLRSPYPRAILRIAALYVDTE
jgi:hypothetical protein